MATVYERIASDINRLIDAAKKKRDALPWYAWNRRAVLAEVTIPDLETHLYSLRWNSAFGKMFPGSGHAVMNQEFDQKQHSNLALALTFPNDS